MARTPRDGYDVPGGLKALDQGELLTGRDPGINPYGRGIVRQSSLDVELSEGTSDRSRQGRHDYPALWALTMTPVATWS